MAQLPSESIDQTCSGIMSEFSSLWTLIPISSVQLRALLVLIDQELDGAETDIIQALPAGTGKTWLVANQSLARGIMLDVLHKRKEVL